MKHLSIVIPNYNGAKLLRRNLPSVLAAAKAYGDGTTVIVVDDASADDSLSVLSNEFPEVTVVAHDKNKGFSEAVYSGVRHAQSELLFLLNSDVELAPGCLEKLEPYFAAPDTFAACPLMLDEDGSINRHSWNLRDYKRGYLKLVDWDLDTARQKRRSHWLPTMYTSGGSMMVSRSKFLEIGGFHPIYKPFYGEDFDLGIRAWYRGWASYFEPEATVVHQSQGSIKDNVKRSRVKAVRRRNRYFLEWIHIPTRRLVASTFPQTLLQVAGELLTLDMVNLKGFFSALQAIPEVRAVRRATLASSQMTLDDIISKTLAAYRDGA